MYRAKMFLVDKERVFIVLLALVSLLAGLACIYAIAQSGNGNLAPKSSYAFWYALVFLLLPQCRTGF